MTAKLYPHKILADTAKCLMAAEVYKYKVELSNDMNYYPEIANEKNILSYEKPVLICENKSISTTKAICFYFHRLENKNRKCCDESLYFYMKWINWCELIEEYIESINKKKVIECLDELDIYLKENKERNRNFINININENENENEIDTLSLADVFIYISITQCEIQICEKSWKYISAYLDTINKIQKVQDIMKQLEKIYSYKNIYKVFISKIEEKNINEYIKKQTFYTTTAINYVNGVPHIGHAYEIILTDAFSRYNKNLGRQTYFTTGADEHGIKIANQAKKNNMSPEEFCNKNVMAFQELNKVLCINEDYYARTTHKIHKNIVQQLWCLLEKKGDIYLGEYEGWYNIREETYITENEAKLTNYLDPVSKVKLEKMKEPSYFFKMNKYQDQLIDYINKNPDLIIPEQSRNEMLQRLKEPLMDLSCSRATFTWGIPVPSDPKHVMYVWFDALLNYYTSCFVDPNKKREHFWPATINVIGKDIVWFHAVIFLIILMATDLELPKHIFVHGFVLAADGKKMSKSLGNVIDPNEIIEKFGTDAFRYHLIKETKAGCDLRFDVDNLIDMCNSDLADVIGNLVNRIMSLCVSTSDSKIPPYFEKYTSIIKVPFNILRFINSMEFYMKQFRIEKCCDKTINICKVLNKYLTDLEPWKLKDNEKDKKMHIIRIMLESIYFLAHYLDIFIPSIASKIFKKLNTPQKKIVDLSTWLDNLQEGTMVYNEGILFKKIDVLSASIKMQKVVMKVCKIVNMEKTKTNEKYTICTIQIEDEEKLTALLNMPLNQKYINAITLTITNVKPFTLSNYTITSVIPYVKDSIFLFPEEKLNNSLGTLIKAKNYPVLAKQRDKLTKKEISMLNISVNKNNVFFDKNIPLVFASSEQPVNQSSISSGSLQFF